MVSAMWLTIVKRYVVPQSLLMLLCTVLVSVRASADQFNDFTYEVTPSNTVTITKYTGTDGSVSIPSMIASNSVTSIGDKAFFRCRELASVTIPDSVTTIGNSALRG